MPIKTTHLLPDDPATSDEFGTHKKIADLLREEILHSTEGRSIALVGDWGSGKSTVIELLRREIGQGQNATSHLFVYDAWSHQGDSLRRAFLDDFIASLDWRLTTEQLTDATDKIWNQTETTTTTTEPVLRRHAKALLLTLAFIPLGMKLFDLPSKTELWTGLLQARNIFAYALILAPVICVTVFALIRRTTFNGLKRFLFGDSYSESHFSVLSFFVERTQGRIEHKHTKTPLDSIRSFRDVFSQILDDIQERYSDLRIVFVIDNIDRIPPEQARDFWSTMQTFFGDSGGLRRPQTKKYWLIAPFSIQAISFIFQDSISPATTPQDLEGAAESSAKAFIDKTFGLTCYVPPPILANWRKYLLDKLATAFPEHDLKELVAVRDVFDFARSDVRITPREMKLFVNSLVVFYRQRGEEISLVVMAIYLLHRENISDSSIPEDLIPARQRALIDDADWQVPIAALHFGVSLADATQLLIQDPMLKALREGSSDQIKELESKPGFFDVLRRVMASELESPTSESGAAVSRLAATIGALDGAGKPELSGVWRDLRSHLKQVKNWTGLQKMASEGIRVVIFHAPEYERPPLCQAVARSLSQDPLADPDGDLQKPNVPAANWLRVAEALAIEIDPKSGTRINLPGSSRLKLELLQQLAESDQPDAVKAVFALNTTAAEISNALAAEITNGRYPRSQIELVSLLAEKMKIDVQWSSIANACRDRLRVVDIGPGEAAALTKILLASWALANFNQAYAILKELSEQGFLSHLLQQHQSAEAARGAIIGAILFANPSFNRPGQNNQSPGGDALFNQLADGNAFDPKQIEAVSALTFELRFGTKLFSEGAQNPKVARLAASVLADLTRNNYNFSTEPKTIIEKRKFLEAQASLNPVVQFLQRQKKSPDLITLLSQQPFEVDRSQFYRAALQIEPEEPYSPYANFLKDGFLALDKNQWVQSLNARDGAFFELLQLAGDLRKLDEHFEVSATARDAILEQVRNVGAGNPTPSDEVRERLSDLLRLLPESLRNSLIRDIVDDIVGETDSEQITRLIETIGEHLHFDNDSEPDRIVRRIFSPIVTKPTDRSASWMASMVNRQLDFFRSIPDETKEEFGWRIQTALRNEGGLTETVSAALTNTAGLLSIALTGGDDKNKDTTATEQK